MYDILVIDPPWPKKKGGLRKVRPKQTRELDYSTLSVSEIFQLLDSEIFPEANDPHTAFLWGIDQFLLDGEQAMLDRGYRLHARLIWNKENGIAPAFSVRYSHEYVSWLYKPKFMPVATSERGKASTVFIEKAREHSRKPDAFYKQVDLWYPTAKKIDVFSREKRSGWDQFGNEIEHFTPP